MAGMAAGAIRGAIGGIVGALEGPIGAGFGFGVGAMISGSSGPAWPVDHAANPAGSCTWIESHPEDLHQPLDPGAA